MYMPRIGVNGIHFTTFVVDYSGDVFFNSVPMFRFEGRGSQIGNQDKVGIEVIIFNFHGRIEGNKVDFHILMVSRVTKVINL